LTRGKTLLLTRPNAQSQALAADIATRHPTTRCIISPLLDIAFTGATLPLYTTVLFTSANGVRAYVQAGGRTGVTCFCVGAGTAAAAKAAGLRAQTAAGDVAALARLVNETATAADAPMLYVRGEHAAANVIALLRPDLAVSEAVLYRQDIAELTPQARAALAAGAVDAIPLYSPRTAHALAAEFNANPLWPRTPDLLCLSENVARALGAEHSGPVSVAKSPERDDMLALIDRFLGQT